MTEERTTYAWICPYCEKERMDIVDKPGPGAPKRPEVRPGGPTAAGIFDPIPLCPHCECGDAPYWEELPIHSRLKPFLDDAAAE